MALIEDIIKENLQDASEVLYEKINGDREVPVYLHDALLTPEYSVDMTYESLSGEFSRVTADVVSFDSPLPIKKRSSIKSAAGDIPKLGLKFTMNEKQMNNLRILSMTPKTKSQLAAKIFNDSENCIYGIKELLDQMLLSSISSQAMLIPEEGNTGTAVRLSYDVNKDNVFGAVDKWSGSDAKPISDIKRIIRAARDKGVILREIWMDVYTMETLLSNQQVRDNYAFTQNFVGANVPNLLEEQLILLFSSVLKVNLNVIDRSFTKEKNGKRTVVEGWEPNQVVFTPSKDLGKLFWSTCAEEFLPVEGVVYAKPNDYILLSMSGKTDPVSHQTSGQAIVAPILQDVDAIFYLDVEEAATDVQTEGDANFDYTTTGGVTAVYTRSSVIDALNLASKKSKATVENTDEELLDKINALSDKQIETFEANIVAV
ncbi:major capsid protein [Aquimarina sp. 2201CG5-10]|uniref:major capsid protein n=1 Tax=Aquimarina callyspongiae TaxID=3098150 RepID=UPI002AB32D04|nr:major capsid protein [Aquimarina sp. 2201CG5-10]MDY8137566.1 major capsid protein [Aquimarina sp. 2201CG5-10]